MCGLAGCLLGPGVSDQQLKLIKEIFVANLLANEERGREATGVVSCGADGSSNCHKAALPAHDFVQTAGCKGFMKSAIDTSTSIILGHTREPTKGTVENNNNNHPIVVGKTVGVHNGVISNDDSIFSTLSSGLQPKARIGAVDSEAIFALLDRVDPQLAMAEYVKGLQRAAGQLVGSFTTLFFNKNLPSTLFCLRYDNPISSHFQPELNCLFFSSRYVFLRKTFGSGVISKGMPGRTGFVFEAEKIASQGKRPSRQFRLGDQ
ncbi:MAG: hypothetical protein ABFR97_07420 [Thermodesulfobacteriota bacterium]